VHTDLAVAILVKQGHEDLQLLLSQVVHTELARYVIQLLWAIIRAAGV
jgi:hypothetical protein